MILEALEVGGTLKTVKTRMSCGRQSAMKMLEMPRTLRLEISTVDAEAKWRQVADREAELMALKTHTLLKRKP